MLNQVILVGKLNSEPEIKSTIQGELGVFIELLVNTADSSEYHVVPVQLSDGIAVSSSEYISMDMTLGIKGHLAYEDSSLKVIADKITFINTKQGDYIE